MGADCEDEIWPRRFGEALLCTFFIKFTQLSYFNYNHLKQLYLFIETFSHDSFVRQAVSTFDIWLRESSVKITFNLDLVGYIK